MGLLSAGLGDAGAFPSTGGGAASPSPQASDQNLLAWAADPTAPGSNNAAPNAGVLFLTKLPVRLTQTFSTLWVFLNTGGAGTTLANSFLGLYSLSGGTFTLIGASSDQSSNWMTVNSVARSAALTVQGGQSLTQSSSVWGGLLIGTQAGTTTAKFSQFNVNNALANIGQTAGTDALRCASSGTSQTSLPATVAVSGLAAVPGFWMAAS